MAKVRTPKKQGGSPASLSYEAQLWQMAGVERDNPALKSPLPKECACPALANGSMSSNLPGEGEIRKSLVEVDLVDCIVTLRSPFFYSFHNTD